MYVILRPRCFFASCIVRPGPSPILIAHVHGLRNDSSIIKESTACTCHGELAWVAGSNTELV